MFWVLVMVCFFVFVKTCVARRMTVLTSSNEFSMDIRPREFCDPLDPYDIQSSRR
jgi:hypothetical protein